MYDRQERATNGIGPAPMRDYPEDKFIGKETLEKHITIEEVFGALMDLSNYTSEVAGRLCGYEPETTGVNPGKDTTSMGRFAEQRLAFKTMLHTIHATRRQIERIQNEAT